MHEPEVPSAPTQGRRGRARTVVVVLAIAAIVLVSTGIWYYDFRPKAFGPSWTVPAASFLGGGAVANGSYYFASATTNAWNASCGGNGGGQNFTVTNLSLADGHVAWISTPVDVPCTVDQGFPQRVAVLGNQVDLAVTMNGLAQGGTSRLVLTAFDRSSGVETSSITYAQSRAEGIDNFNGDWPTASGVLVTWAATTPASDLVTAYSLITLRITWSTNVSVPAVGVGVRESANFPFAGPGGFGAGDAFCLTTDPEVFPSGDFHVGGFQFRNSSVACLSTGSGSLLWQRNFSGPATPVLGSASSSDFYYLDNSSGSLRVEGVSLSTGAPMADFPLVDLGPGALAYSTVEAIDGIVTVTTSGAAGAPPGVPWGVFQGYSLSGSLLWNDTIPADSLGIVNGGYYYLHSPMGLTGNRLLLSDTLGGNYGVSPELAYTQVLEVVDASTGQVLAQHSIDIFKEQTGQFGGSYIGAWYPVLTDQSSFVYYSEGSLGSAVV